MSIGATMIVCIALTAAGLALTVPVARRRGTGAGLRLAGVALVPVGLWLTGLTRLLGAVVDTVARFSTGLLFSPAVWAGVVLLGLSAALYGVGGRVSARQRPRPRSAGPAASLDRARADAEHDDMADIEALLRRRGIS